MNIRDLSQITLFFSRRAHSKYAIDCKEVSVEPFVRMWKLFLNHTVFCRLTDAIKQCFASQSLQTLRLRLLTKLHKGVHYIVDLPQSLKTLKLTVWDISQVNALMQLSSLKDLDLEFGERFNDRGMRPYERRWKTSWSIREVIATFKGIP